MKLAIAGKGGSGKTSVSGTLARKIGREGHSVLAIDGDTNPNLSLTLGIPAERFNDVPVLPSGLHRRRPQAEADPRRAAGVPFRSPAPIR